MTTTFKIYALVDPRTGEPRYIGQTRSSLKTRLGQHKTRDVQQSKGRWIKQLLATGVAPVIRQLFECYDIKTANDAEVFFIQDFRNRGFDLLNVAIGGHALLRLHTEESKARIAAARLGKKHTPETLAKLSREASSRKPSEDTRERIRSFAKSRAATPEGRAQLLAKTQLGRAAWTGKKHTAEALAKMAEARLRRKTGKVEAKSEDSI